ncbi:34991_t:CDS:2 [Gigaspora margarita]|uniref:34991_t:CDS:1 n=1 Tax=Gigaspora margarita TaxID=4874 RepID=A0ABN7UX84_GIGMA|nr:34991_t:CDS:2 [Gigaspora margarita]
MGDNFVYIGVFGGPLELADEESEGRDVEPSCIFCSISLGIGRGP